MKFGEHLTTNKVPEWESMYLDYNKLKKLIKQLEALNMQANISNAKGASLSIPRPTNAAGIPVPRNEEASQEQFFSLIEQEMRKIEQFTKKMVLEVRQSLQSVETEIGNLPRDDLGNPIVPEEIMSKVDKAADTFLNLEKFVNINFTGFHKILKKHDRRLPNPCKAFYIARLHEQSWVRGDFSDVIVTMSRIYSTIRGDAHNAPNQDEKQDFVRSTTKYWVHTEDISKVKYIVLQHLPVFLQDSMDGGTDAQLVNSVYLDNRSFELYRGRMDKTPGAIALRFRWYGTSIPKVVFVERKTHRESWMGELSVKERFIIPEPQVFDLLRGKYDKGPELSKMKSKGSKQTVIDEWEQLVNECAQAINSKQLEPTMRTQYMRTAFQIPFDATVRVSLDTNLCMMNERTENVISGERWFRDPEVEIPSSEITRFPHAVLEIKLQLEDANATPEWVTELMNSGMLMEVHKFSKFIHGCATLLTDEVQSVPYWIDDPTLAESIRISGAAQLLDEVETSEPKGARDRYNHVIVHDASGNSKPQPHLIRRAPKPEIRREYGSIEERPSLPPKPSTEINFPDDAHVPRTSSFNNETDPLCMCLPPVSRWCEWADSEALGMKPQKIEPKLFFANERTFMKWLEMAVILSSISIGILAFSEKTGTSQYYAMILLPISLMIIAYALWTYLWRARRIGVRDPYRWDDPSGPIVITSLLIVALCTQFIQKLYQVYVQRNTLGPLNS